MQRSAQHTINAIISALMMLVLSAACGMATGSRDSILVSLFDEDVLASNTDVVRIRAAALPVAERYDYLADWVLPSATHTNFRMQCSFTQADPSPIAIDTELTDDVLGGRLQSPVLDLLDLASQTDRLEELQRRIENVPEGSGDYHQRARLAMLLLVAREAGDREAMLDATDQLYELAHSSVPAEMNDVWPETIVVYRCLLDADSEPIVNELVNGIFSQRTTLQTVKGKTQWHSLITALLGRRRQERFAVAGKETLEQPDDWIPAVRSRARTRGNGHFSAEWVWDGREGHHISGHDHDILFFGPPLRGNFSVEGDIGAGGSTQFKAAGEFFSSSYRLDKLETGTFRIGASTAPLDPPFSRMDDWVRFRVVFQDGVCTKFINGREVIRQPLSRNTDPWLAFRSWYRNAGRFRDVRITGTPEVPDSVPLVASPDLMEWVPYFEESAGYYTAHWRYQEDEENGRQIIGRLEPTLYGTFCESLLRYHRPLVEDGSIEYEFYYEPGRSHVYPALDRLAFLLSPDGVRIHWVTDAMYDRSPVAPNNAIEEPDSPLGPDQIPLQPGKWNRARLQIKDDVVSLYLNDQQVCERVLEPTNRRTFGLFHYSDLSEARVRNIVMRGDWPKSVPQISEQPLADQLASSLDADQPELESVFSHEFASEGLPGEYFKTSIGNQGQIQFQADGILARQQGIGVWAATELKLPFVMHGDFDIEASFDGLQIESDKDACIILITQIEDAKQSICRNLRIRAQGDREQLHVSLSQMHPSGHRSYSPSIQETCEAYRGRLRLARRGDVVYWMFAENDSEVFQVFGSEVVADAPTSPDGVVLRSQCNGLGGASVVWKNVTLRAERLTWMPADAGPEPRQLHVMKSDGTDPRAIMQVPEGFTQFGSPEWSADGKHIALDASNGSTNTSRVLVIDADGGNQQDLGPGCMPSFSADGQQIVFSQAGEGIVMMDSDGSNRQVVSSQGWGTQWSPDGKFIAFGEGRNITIMDVASREQRPLLVEDQASQYNFIYWNFGWSHDSRSICAKARRNSGAYDVIVADIDSPDGFQVLHSSNGSINADFTWDPDNRTVLFSMHNAAHKGPQLYMVSRDEPGQPILFPAQPRDQKIYDCAWSPDGHYIVFSSQRFPQPVDWVSNRKSSD